MLDILVDLSDELDRELDYESLLLHYEEVLKELDLLE